MTEVHSLSALPTEMKNDAHYHTCHAVKTYHISMGVEYSTEPKRTSGGRYLQRIYAILYMQCHTKENSKHQMYLKYILIACLLTAGLVT